MDALVHQIVHYACVLKLSKVWQDDRLEASIHATPLWCLSFYLWDRIGMCA